MSQSFHCPLCDRPMPPHIYEFHLKKSHPLSEAEKLRKTEVHEVLENLEEGFGAEQAKIETKQFDWGEVYSCSACGDEYPAKAMPFHSWVRHRV